MITLSTLISFRRTVPLKAKRGEFATSVRKIRRFFCGVKITATIILAQHKRNKRLLKRRILFAALHLLEQYTCLIIAQQ